MDRTATCPSVTEFTIAWITALPLERAAALELFDEIHTKPPKDFNKSLSDHNSYDWGRVSDHNIVLTSLPSGEMGTTSSADTVGGLRSSLPHIRLGLLVGIGAGIPIESADAAEEERVLLGDVVVSIPKGANGGVVQYDFVEATQEKQLK